MLAGRYIPPDPGDLKRVERLKTLCEWGLSESHAVTRLIGREREACAKLAEGFSAELAAEIRKRGQSAPEVVEFPKGTEEQAREHNRQSREFLANTYMGKVLASLLKELEALSGEPATESETAKKLSALAIKYKGPRD